MTAHRVYLGRGCKVGGYALGGLAHHPTGFIVAAQLCIQNHPVPATRKGYSLGYTADLLALSKEKQATNAMAITGKVGRQAGRQRGGQETGFRDLGFKAEGKQEDKQAGRLEVRKQGLGI